MEEENVPDSDNDKDKDKDNYDDSEQSDSSEDSDGSSSSTSCTITLPKHPYATSFTTPSVLITSAPDPPKKSKQPSKSKPVRIKHYSSYDLSRGRRPPFTVRLGCLVCVTLDASCKMGDWKQYQGTFEDLTLDPRRGKYATSTVRYASKSKVRERERERERERVRE